MHELIERLESLRRQILSMTASGNDYGLSEAIAALRSKQEPAGEPVAFQQRHRSGDGPTPAIALLIALIRALEAGK